MMTANKKLTPKQERFALNLFKGLSQRQAYMQAGYSSNTSPEVIDVKAYELTQVGKISDRLEELKQKAEDKTLASDLERKQRLTTSIRGDITDYIAPDGDIILNKDSPNRLAVSQYTIRETRYGTSKSIKLLNPHTAIDVYNRRENLYKEPVQFQDNRTYNILVQGDEARTRFTKLLEGRMPQDIEVEDATVKEEK